MLAIAAAVLFSAATPIKVAVPGFTVSGAEGNQSDAWVDRFITLLSAGGDLKFITSRDIAQVLGVERQKELLGCSESQGSCLTELAGALGVDAILTGTIAKSGSSYSATLRVLKSNDGSQIAAVTGRVKDLDALQDWFDAQAPELGRQIRAAFGIGTAEAPAGAVSTSSSPSRSGRGVRLVPVIAGGALAIVGGVLYGLSKVEAAKLQGSPLTRAEINASLSAGPIFEGAGLGMLVGGLVLVAAGVVWLLVGGSS
jgi:hypothetical protein